MGARLGGSFEQCLVHAHEAGEVGQPLRIPSSLSIAASILWSIQRSIASSIALGSSRPPQRPIATSSAKCRL